MHFYFDRRQIVYRRRSTWLSSSAFWLCRFLRFLWVTSLETVRSLVRGFCLLIGLVSTFSSSAKFFVCRTCAKRFGFVFLCWSLNFYINFWWSGSFLEHIIIARVGGIWHIQPLLDHVIFSLSLSWIPIGWTCMESFKEFFCLPSVCHLHLKPILSTSWNQHVESPKPHC